MNYDDRHSDRSRSSRGGGQSVREIVDAIEARERLRKEVQERAIPRKAREDGNGTTVYGDDYTGQGRSVEHVTPDSAPSSSDAHGGNNGVQPAASVPTLPGHSVTLDTMDDDI